MELTVSAVQTSGPRQSVKTGAPAQQNAVSAAGSAAAHPPDDFAVYSKQSTGNISTGVHCSSCVCVYDSTAPCAVCLQRSLAARQAHTSQLKAWIASPALSVTGAREGIRILGCARPALMASQQQAKARTALTNAVGSSGRGSRSRSSHATGACACT